MRLRHYRKKHLLHSAKGSEWEEHKYVKKVDGDYYYPDGYENGRNISSLKEIKDSDKSESSSEEKVTDTDEHALRAIRGDYGNGQDRKDALGEDYEQIQKRVNELMKSGEYKNRVIDSATPQEISEGEKSIKKYDLTPIKQKTTAEKGIDMSSVLKVYDKQKKEGR